MIQQQIEQIRAVRVGVGAHGLYHQADGPLRQTAQHDLLGYVDEAVELKDLLEGRHEPDEGDQKGEGFVGEPKHGAVPDVDGS